MSIHNGDWADRKARRADYFRRFVHGWRERPCTGCNGSGYYDDDGSPPCGACEGTGKEIYRGPKAQPEGNVDS